MDDHDHGQQQSHCGIIVDPQLLADVLECFNGMLERYEVEPRLVGEDNWRFAEGGPVRELRQRVAEVMGR